ncbi:MAG: hypothetical protein M4579_001438 [Chaenotheca gracillima]|nr:MAG: hypothetical protein M4579_001438 [Chaenotheca gracillima]
MAHEDETYHRTGLQDALQRIADLMKSEQSSLDVREVLPPAEVIRRAENSLITSLPTGGFGADITVNHILSDIAPALNKSSLSPNYYGFVTGGYTEAAGIADQIVSIFDQNVQVHLPKETISTVVEDRALRMLLELFDLDNAQWPGRTFTTGATASNIVGLACAREGVLNAALRRSKGEAISGVGQRGIVRVCLEAGLSGFQILTTMSHSSLRKAASVIGLGRDSVVDVGSSSSPWIFDLERLEVALRDGSKASIVAISSGEVNTGRFATTGLSEFEAIRALCDKYGAWIHVDGAFGIFGRLLHEQEYEYIKAGCAGMELADSIAGDAHKLLNVPYDCGFVFCRSLDIMQNVFQNSNAAYLSSSSASDIASPLNIGIENSRRFRALPVYSTLMAYGKSGYQDMIRRQISLARNIVRYFSTRQEYFDTLPFPSAKVETNVQNTYIIVLFRAKDESLNQELVRKINASGRMYVSGSMWEGKPAARIAVSNWNVDLNRDTKIIQEVLDGIIPIMGD